MSALQAGKIVKQLLTARERQFPVAAATVCWEGGMVALSGSGSAAVAAPPTAAVGLKIVGVATGNADNRLGAAGAINVDVASDAALMNNSATDPVGLGDIGSPCYAADDNTVSKTGAPASGSPTQSQAGVVWNIDPSGAVWVKFIN
ncbi:MAG: hypothetical protein ABSA66_15780 [Roseiarcus sp.]|jgi:hypothetical protein